MNVHLLSVDYVGHVEGFQALEHTRCIELRLELIEALLGAQEHVELSPRAVVHPYGRVLPILHEEPLLHEKLGHGESPLHVLQLFLDLPPGSFLSRKHHALLVHLVSVSRLGGIEVPLQNQFLKIVNGLLLLLDGCILQLASLPHQLLPQQSE